MEPQQPSQQGSVPQAPGVQPVPFPAPPPRAAQVVQQQVQQTPKTPVATVFQAGAQQPAPMQQTVQPNPVTLIPQPQTASVLQQQPAVTQPNSQPKPATQPQPPISQPVSIQSQNVPSAPPQTIPTAPVQPAQSQGSTSLPAQSMSAPPQLKQVPILKDDVIPDISPAIAVEEVPVATEQNSSYKNNSIKSEQLFTADELPEPNPSLSPIHTEVDHYSVSQQEVFRSNRRRRLMVILTSLVTLLIISSAIFGYFFWKKSYLALEKYEGIGFSMKYPKGYKESEFFPFVSFSEPSNIQKDQSYIAVMAQPYSKELTNDEYNTIKNSITIDKISSFFGQSNNSVSSSGAYKNVSMKNEEFSNRVVYNGSADYYQKDNKLGTVYYNYDLSKKYQRIIVIGVNKTDPKLAKNAQKIIDSVKLNSNN